MAHSTHVPITPAVLRWAIQESGIAIDELAARLDVEVDTLQSWQQEQGLNRPILTQFRRLVDVLKRPSATFFLAEPPKSLLPSVQFRHPTGIGRNSLNDKERRYLRESARLQRALSWVLTELKSPSVSIPKLTVGSNIDDAASSARQLLGITDQAQSGWKNSSEAFHEWRAALERIGIFIYLFPLGKDSCRGFSLWDDRAPVIAINTAWNTEARIFTIFHEYAHLMSRTNSACVEGAAHKLSNNDDILERWCERFAASLLMPWNAVADFLSTNFGWREGKSIEDIEIVRVAARRFKVSLRAATLKLIERKVSTWELYSQIPDWSDEKRPGGGGEGRKRGRIKEDQYGTHATTLFVKAVDEALLSRADALSYLDVLDSDFDKFQRRIKKS